MQHGKRLCLVANKADGNIADKYRWGFLDVKLRGRASKWSTINRLSDRLINSKHKNCSIWTQASLKNFGKVIHLFQFPISQLISNLELRNRKKLPLLCMLEFHKTTWFSKLSLKSGNSTWRRLPEIQRWLAGVFGNMWKEQNVAQYFYCKVKEGFNS